MDSNPPVIENPSTQTPPSTPPQTKILGFIPSQYSTLLKTTSAVLLLLIVVGALYFYTRNASPNSQITNLKKQGVIAKVGSEYIYQKDLDHEIASNPPSTNSAALRTTLLNKLVTDSVIIQGGLTDQVASADATVYNSPTKDYAKRQKLVTDIVSRISTQKTNRIAGTLVAIWFDNGRTSTVGDNARKLIAFQKITKLHDEVKSGAITLDQAINDIKNDSSLASLDSAYKTNASANFSVSGNEPITFDPNFDTVLLAQPLGVISDVYLLKDHQYLPSNPANGAGPLIDAVYMFGIVSNKTQGTGFNNFDDWLTQERKVYEVTYY